MRIAAIAQFGFSVWLNQLLARVRAVERSGANGHAPLEWRGLVEVCSEPLEYIRRSRLGRSLNKTGGISYISRADVLLGVGIWKDWPRHISRAGRLLTALAHEAASGSTGTAGSTLNTLCANRLRDVLGRKSTGSDAALNPGHHRREEVLDGGPVSAPAVPDAGENIQAHKLVDLLCANLFSSAV